jgi:hypothetical protein
MKRAGIAFALGVFVFPALSEFVLASIDTASATFEDSAHNFPKRIHYAKRAYVSLEASVTDGKGKGDTFVFRQAR